jgi:hypothetical protein
MKGLIATETKEGNLKILDNQNKVLYHNFQNDERAWVAQ